MEPIRAAPGPLPPGMSELFAKLAADRGWTHRTGRFAGQLNAAALARDLGLSRQHVNRIIAGETKRIPSTFKLAVLRQAEQTYGNARESDYFPEGNL